MKKLINFEKYFEKILYDKKNGYYTNPDRKIGLEGDFITSPSLLPEPFGRTISNFINKNILKENKKFKLVEIGGREGEFLKILGKFSGLETLLIEKANKNFSRMKKEIFSNKKENYIFFMNEVFDAIPVRRIKFDGKDFFESFIDLNEKNNNEIWKKIEDVNVKKYYQKYLNFTPEKGEKVIFEYPEKYISFSEKFKTFKRDTYIIIIDYGGYPSELYPDYMSTETIRGYKNHKIVENIFEMEEAFDITYHVNFKFIEDLFLKIGYQKVLYNTQGKFLIENGILNYVKKRDEIQKLKTLILPGGMGDLFKVMVLKK